MLQIGWRHHVYGIGGATACVHTFRIARTSGLPYVVTVKLTKANCNFDSSESTPHNASNNNRPLGCVSNLGFETKTRKQKLKIYGGGVRIGV